MSHEWYVYCLTCQSRHDLGVNHGDEQMRVWVRHASAIGALLPLVQEHWSEVSLTSYDRHLDVRWFAEHHAHELTVIDEYGRVQDQCESRVACSGCGRQHDCYRTRNHEGPCSPREADRGT